MEDNPDIFFQPSSKGKRDKDKKDKDKKDFSWFSIRKFRELLQKEKFNKEGSPQDIARR